MISALRPDRRVEVVHVTHGLEVGGLEKLLVEIARHADRTRQRLHFVSLSSRGVLAAEIEKCGWPVTALEAPAGVQPAVILQLAALFRGWRATVVHTHNTKALVYGGPAARLARVEQLLHTWHGQNLVGSPREAFLFRLAGKLPDDIIAVSNDAARIMQGEGIAPAKITRIWNGIDTSRFAYTGPCSHGPAVAVARLSPEKDIASLVRAVALLREQEPHFRVEVAGAGLCLSVLQRLAAELGVTDNVCFRGQVDDIPALLARARLFVLPSLTEGVSLTLLEALARGLPVVATRVGGNPEVVHEGQTGLLVPPSQPNALANAILRLWRDPELGRAMGAAGRQRVEEHFEVRGMVARYEELYQRNRRLAARRSLRSGAHTSRPNAMVAAR
jgi:glycosyltransferase involved in cell wall biosynthesis